MALSGGRPVVAVAACRGGLHASPGPAAGASGSWQRRRLRRADGRTRRRHGAGRRQAPVRRARRTARRSLQPVPAQRHAGRRRLRHSRFRRHRGGGRPADARFRHDDPRDQPAGRKRGARRLDGHAGPNGRAAGGGRHPVRHRSAEHCNRRGNRRRGARAHEGQRHPGEPRARRDYRRARPLRASPRPPGLHRLPRCLVGGADPPRCLPHRHAAARPAECHRLTAQFGLCRRPPAPDRPRGAPSPIASGRCAERRRFTLLRRKSGCSSRRLSPSAQHLRVDDIVGVEPAVEAIDHILRGRRAHAEHGLFGHARRMRRHDDVVELEQRLRRGRRLDDEGVDARARDDRFFSAS